MPSADEIMRRLVADALYDALMTRPGSLAIGTLVRALPDTMPLSADFARQVIEADPRFVCEGARCDLAIRQSIAGANLKSVIERLAQDRGAPVPIGPAASLLAAVNQRETGYYLQVLRAAASESGLAHAVDDALVPLDWLLVPEGDNEDDVLFYSGLDADPLLAQLLPICSPETLRAATPRETAANLLRAAQRPVPNRLLDFLVYRLHPQAFDARELLSQMLADPTFYAMPGLCWVCGVDRSQVAAALAEADQHSAALRSQVRELARLLDEPLPPEHPGYFISDAHIDALYELIQTSTRPVEVADILAEILELPPDHPNYLAAAHSVRILLADDPQIMPLGYTCFIGSAGVPAWARELPAGVLPTSPISAQDVILRPEGLRPGLADRLADPYWEDFGDPGPEVARADLASSETTFTLLAHHCATGALKLRAMDQRLFGDSELDPRPISLIGPGGLEVTVWLNVERGMLIGLKPLLDRHHWASGTLLTLSQADAPARFYVSSPGEDPEVTLSDQRLAELAALLAPSAGAPPSTFALLQAILASYPDGARFERLLADISAVRRVSRLQLASLLSYYQVFRPRDQRGDDWVLVPDAQGVVAGKDKHLVTPA